MPSRFEHGIGLYDKYTGTDPDDAPSPDKKDDSDGANNDRGETIPDPVIETRTKIDLDAEGAD